MYLLGANNALQLGSLHETLGLDLFDSLGKGSTLPRYTTTTSDGGLVTEVDLPGVLLENLNIDVEDDSLSISGHRNSKRFAFRLFLDKKYDVATTEAKLEHGVLTLTTMPHKSRSLKIQVK